VTRPYEARGNNMAFSEAPNLERLELSRPKRPMGVWLGTIGWGMGAGLLPLISVLRSVAMATSAAQLTPTAIASGVVTLLVCGAAAAAAVGTWKGNRRALYVFLSGTSFYYVGMGVVNYLAWRNGGIAETTASGWIFRGFLMPLVAWGYFLRPSVRAFFGGSHVADSRSAN